MPNSEKNLIQRTRDFLNSRPIQRGFERIKNRAQKIAPGLAQGGGMFALSITLGDILSKGIAAVVMRGVGLFKKNIDREKENVDGAKISR
jgi:hypothetical protein